MKGKYAVQVGFGERKVVHISTRGVHLFDLYNSDAEIQEIMIAFQYFRITKGKPVLIAWACDRNHCISVL